jgi:hypothetical protein
MGCTSSSPSFRNTYSALQKRWHLCSESYNSSEESNVNERSRLFESCTTERARKASSNLLFRGHCVFKCSPLLIEQLRLQDPPFAEEGKKEILHPYTAVLYQRLLGAVSVEHAYHVFRKDVVSSRITHFLTRWDYRIWMITCCEFFHVMAVFKSAKALPKEVRAYMNSLPEQLKSCGGHPASGLKGSAGGESINELLIRTWKEGAATSITAKMLTPKVINALKTQFPSMLCEISLPDRQDNSLVAKRLILLAREYEIRLEKAIGLHNSNPLYASCGKESQSNPSFLSFVEWVALQAALSFCGKEEDPTSYGVVQIEYSEKVLKYENDALQMWRKHLRRFETVKEQLTVLEPLGDRSESYVALQAEKKEIELEIEKQFAKWRGTGSSLTAADAAENCFTLLDIRRTLPDSIVHEVLSAKAFENATNGSESSTIDTADEFRQYMKAYIALHDLYREVLLHQLEASRKDGTYDVSCMPGSVNFESFRAALWSSQMRHDIELDPLMAAVGGGKGVLSADEVAAVFQQLFNMDGAERPGDGTKKLNFDAVCTMVAEDSVPAGESLVLRSPIEQLGDVIGLTDAKGQSRFIASFLNRVFTLSGNKISNCGTTLAAEALEAVVELPRYTDYSAGIGAMAIRFAYLSPPQWALFAVKESSSTDLFVRWLYKIQSESADRLSLDDHINCDFFVRTFFSIAAAQRAFEDTVSDEAEERPANLRNTAKGKNTTATQKVHEAVKSHFVRAVASMCTYLDCSAEVLLHNCSSLLIQSENDTSQAASTDSNFAVESAFASLHRAFLRLEGGRGREADGAESEDVGDEKKEPTVSIQHVLFVVVSNYTRLHCAAHWRANNVYDFLEDSAFGANGELAPKWKNEKEVLAFSNAMPLRCMNSTYREFAELTKLCAGSDAGEDSNVESAFQRRFLHAFYEHYKVFFAELELGENAVAEMGQRAFRYITNNPTRVGSGDILTCNDYSGFMQFVLGQVMMQKVYECIVREPAEKVGMVRDVDEEVFLSERDLRRMLGCFTRLTDGGASNVPPVEEAHAWLQSHGIDNGYEGFFSLDNVFLWYGAHRIMCYAMESLFCWWKEKMAPRIPFTVSTEHRHTRLSCMREILRIKQHRENLPEDEPVEVAEDEDGYLPVGIISHVLNKQGSLDEVTVRVFRMFEEENAADGAVAGADGAEMQGADGAFEAAAWFKSCVRGLNAVVHRSDLESREVHHSDFRFLLQYVHHFVSAYAGLYYSLTILEVSTQGDMSRTHVDQIIGVSDEDRACLVDIFRQSVLPLLLPNGAGAGPAEMTSVLDTLLSKAWEDKRTKGVVMDSICQEIAHGIAALFVRHTHEISARARHSYLDNCEAQALQEAFQTDHAFLGALGGFAASAKLKYWERLRLLLPFGPSLRHRERRRELYLWMDRHQRGYLTITDLAAGLMDFVQLQSFRADFTPALLRAFMATKEMSGEHENVVYLTQKSEEQVLLPSELDAFLTYLYRYLELYFMFDVLTCGGHVHPETLHVVQKEQSYGGHDDEPTSGLAKTNLPAAGATSVASTTGTSTTRISATSAASRSGAAALLEASKKPYQITLEAAAMKKEITLAQFRMGGQLLRKWGAHVKNPDEVFYVNNRRREAGAMSFIGFAIWASQHDLHPEGYGYGYDDTVDAIATMEEEYTSL